MSGIVILSEVPALLLPISTTNVSFFCSLLAPIALNVASPTKRIGPCICANATIVTARAAKKVKILFIFE